MLKPKSRFEKLFYYCQLVLAASVFLFGLYLGVFSCFFGGIAALINEVKTLQHGV